MFGRKRYEEKLGEAAERLRRHVDMLAAVIGERHWWRYEYLMAAEKYVRDQMAATGLAVAEQEFEVMNRPVRNLVAELPGKKRPEEIVVLGAHYDSIDPTPGADDNASGVAGVLEAARQLAGRRFKRTIRFVGFVNEEPPFYKGPDMGSVRYAKQCWLHDEKIVAMVNLEMIGYFDDAVGSQQYPWLGKWGILRRVLPKRGNFIVLCSDFASAGVLIKFRGPFRRGSGRFPTVTFPSPRWVMGPDMSDHWSFWQQGYKALMVTDTSFLRNENYHTARDTVETLDYGRMARVVQGVIAGVAALAGEV